LNTPTHYFLKNKACYLIGRCIAQNGDNMPFAIAILHTDEGLKLDAVMMGADLSMLKRQRRRVW